MDAIANELLSEFVVNKIDLNNQQQQMGNNTATNLLYDNNKIFNPKLSSSDSSESDDICDEDENGAVRDDGTLQISHSKPTTSGL